MKSYKFILINISNILINFIIIMKIILNISKGNTMYIKDNF